ncbi:type II toxin-antitoxin system Phd/YefM family antitoxin [Gordonia neofelifaecis]|uniref:Antitoxin n=1 Tax=Gordonia neofelifaecis NRRL B-59395 TaxID=644548 RepID=F1YNT3_9ACTN|nr:type II toxin-antitoxin system prevent-host-death family antitoxin [Gordonia neofelifaecis]EGD53690.1 prevent-host-death family protein [Gordonia neofelifaecis NRRL B-59395]
MTTVGLRELRQDASNLVRRVEGGDEVTITVSGRPVARLVSAAPKAWREWSAVADLFNGTADPAWEADRQEIDDLATDPWTRRS